MPKKLLATKYEISVSNNSVTVDGNVPLERLLLITNVTANKIIYNFADSALGVTNRIYDAGSEKTTFVLRGTLSNAALGPTTNNDDLQIFIEEEFARIGFEEAMIDPVNKLRVSNPENLIDTDFEYGTQSTKWETLQTVLNIPTIYSTAGDASLEGLVSITMTAGSKQVKCIFTTAHNLAVGDPIIISGVSDITAEGAFLVTGIPVATELYYEIDQTAFETKIVNGSYTNVIPAKFFEGSNLQIDLSNADGAISTNAASPSTLTVRTSDTHGLAVGTKIYLRQTIGPKVLSISNPVGTAPDGRPYIDSSATLTVSNSVSANTGIGAASLAYEYPVVTWDWEPTYVKYLQASDVDAATDIVTWNAHGFANNAALLFQTQVRGTEASPSTNGSLTDGTVYYVKVLTANTFELYSDYGTLASKMNLTAIDLTKGYPRLGLVYKIEAKKDTLRYTPFYTRNVRTGTTGSYTPGSINNSNTNSFTWDVTSFIGGSRIPVAAIIYQLYHSGTNMAGSPVNIYYLARNYLNQGSDNIYYSLAAKGSDTAYEYPNTDVTRCLYLSSGSYYIDIQYQFSAINRDKFGNPTSSYYHEYYLSVDDVPTAINDAHSGSDLASSSFGRGGVSGNKLIAFQGRSNGASSTNGASDAYSYQSNTVNNGRYGTGNIPYVALSTSTNSYGAITVDYNDPGYVDFTSSSNIFYGFANDLTAFKNLLYVPSHGLVNNEVVTLAVTGSGYSTTNRFGFVDSSGAFVPITSASVQCDVNVISSNYIRLTSRIAPFTNDIASYPIEFTISSEKTNPLYNTIYIRNHKIQGSALATYTTAGTVIGGLTSGTVYALSFVNDSRLVIRDSNIVSGSASATTSSFGSTSISANQSFTVNIETPLGVVPNNAEIVGVQFRGYFSGTTRYVTIKFADNINYNIGVINGQNTSSYLDEPTWVSKNISAFLTGSPLGVVVTASPTASVNRVVPGMTNWWEIRFLVTATTGDILLSSSGSGAQNFTVNNVSGAYDGIYTIATTPTTNSFTFGIDFQIPARTYSFNARSTATGGAVNSTDDTIVIGTSNPYAPHNLFPGERITYTPGNGNTDIINDPAVDDYFVIVRDQYTVSLSNSYVSALAGQLVQLSPAASSQTQTLSTTNIVKTAVQSGTVSGVNNTRILSGSGTKFLSKFKRFDSIYILISNRLRKFIVDKITSDTEMTLDISSDVFPSTFNSAQYFTITAVNLRPDGYSLHKSFDGGVDITAGTSPNSRICRQSRKYFRYQSGKGIQNSYAINFSPLKTTQSLTYSLVSGIHVITVVCQEPHNLRVNDSIIIDAATVDIGNNVYNGTFNVRSIVNNTTFTYAVGQAPVQQKAGGFPEYGRNGWRDSYIRAGMFDDSNGFFFEYDGQNLSVVRRSCTLQLSGTCTATRNSQRITGINTSFTGQLVVGDHVSVRGQVYRVVAVNSDSSLTVQPPYRGLTASNIKITKRVDTKIPQSQWNIDPCDGTGVNGYNLDIHKIQMCYADYSWYGAGKIRFGTKDAKGHIHYHHEFIHNNKLNESYFRSGNLPGRYEIENGVSPSSSPTLFHFGTSVIMDGTYDNDGAYLFTGSSKPFVFAQGTTDTITGTSASSFQEITLNARRVYVYSFGVSAADAAKAKVGQLISETSAPGTNIPDGSYVAQVRVEGNNSRIWTSYPATSASPTNLNEIANGTSFTIGENAFGNGAVDLTRPIPLISIRLAPAVDSSLTGVIGEREIVNRMQLILNSASINTNKDVNVFFILNGIPSKLLFDKVPSPSLSNLISHDTGDVIKDGVPIFSTKVSTGSTNIDLKGLIDLGNSILGGDSIFPSGPDLLTVAIQPTDTSTITAASPMFVSGKISWSESQA
jgi:hypothetical protein